MSPQNKIDGIKACVFDAYGTLFDVHSAVGKHRDRLGEKADQVSVLWRTKQLEYTWLRSLMKQHADFWEVTLDALDFSFDMHGIADTNLRDDLMNAYLSLDAYPEVPEVLSVQSVEIIFQSSNAWDAAGAAAFGFNVAWVNRFGQSKERLPGKPDFEIQTLIGLPDLIN